MSRARLAGTLLCLLMVVLGLAYAWGLAQEEWRLWALVIPVSLGVLAVLILGFWMGWTIVVAPTEYPPPTLPEEAPPQPPPPTGSP